MSVGIVDFFDAEHDYHGEIVKDVVDDYYSGLISRYSLGSDGSVFDVIREYREAAGDGHEAINLSIGPEGEGTTNPDYLTDVGYAFEYTMDDIAKEAWNNDTLVFFSAGNYGTEDANKWSATPFAFSVGALDNPLGEREDYSQGHERMTGYWAHGDARDDYEGTSFSAPRVSGAMAEVKETLDLSNPEAITLYEQTAELDEGRLELDYDEFTSANGSEKIEQDEIVDGAYRAFLGRQPGEEGSEYWSNQGESAVNNLSQVAKENGDWNQDLVPVAQRIKAIYNTVLEREADLEGMGFWMEEIKDHDTWQETTESVVYFAIQNGEEIHNHQALNTFLDSEPELIG